MREALVRTSTTWGLPLFLTERNKYPIGAVCVVVLTTAYLATNHVRVFEPQVLPMTWIDRAVPFIPVTIWVYISEFILFPLAYSLLDDLEEANKYLYSLMALQLVSNLSFVLWPTMFPRDLFPLPKDLNRLSYIVFTLLRYVDSPANAVPSLHVSICYLSALVFFKNHRARFYTFFFWATAVAVSTLTTKQHYLVDIIAAFFLTAGIYWMFHHLLPYRFTAENRATHL